MNKTVRILKYLIGWPLSALSLFFVGKLILANSLSLENLSNINIPLLSIGVLIFLMYFFLRSLVWNELIINKGNKFNLAKTIYLWEISEIKRYTPGNIWSFLSRTDLFSQNNILKKDVAISLFDEIILIVLGCFTLSSFYLFYFFNNIFFDFIILLINFTLITSYVFNQKIKFKFFPKLTPEKNLKLYGFSTLAFFCFGLATYFSSISIIYLDPKNLLNLISLFIFALLIGYLSVVTPMGLGVREGVTTFGLSKFISLPNAGLISIFTRIIFIISEIIFLALILLIEKSRNKILPLLNFVNNKRHEILLSLFVLIYSSYYSLASILRHENFYSGRFDLGNMDQTVWNTVNGRIFQMTDPNNTSVVSRLNFHSDFMLILLSPFYFLWNSPKTLLLIQTFVLAFGAIFIFQITNLILKNKNLALIFSTMYLLSPSVGYVNLYDFHAVALSTTLLLATFYFFLKRKYWFFLLFAVLSGLTKEEIWSIIGLFGLAIILRVYMEKGFKFRLKEDIESIFGLFIFIASGAIFYFLIFVIMPYLRGTEHFALSYYSNFGDSTSDVFKNVLVNPELTITTFFSPDRLLYLLKIFFPLGFTSLLSPLYLIFALPDFLIDLLSNNDALHQIYYQYTSSITPFIFISSIYGVKFITNRFPKLGKIIPIFLIFTTLTSIYLFGPLPGSLNANIQMFNKQLSNRDAISKFLEAIPQNYSVSATNNLGAQIAHRINLYNVPNGFGQADMILFLISSSSERQMIAELKNNKKYTLVFENGKFIAFQKTSLLASKPKVQEDKENFQYSIENLIQRDYKKSDIKVENEVATNGNFKSYIISFSSDGLKEYALLNIPNTQKPTNGYPVVVLNHGYIQPNLYNTVTSYKTDSDYFANQGFLVIKPDYRGNGNSDTTDPSLMRFAYPIDVVNLISSIENIKEANSNQIFLWSHSMGGEVSLEVLEIASSNKKIAPNIKGAVFWAPVTDPVKWFSKSHLPQLQEARETPYPYTQTFQILGTPDKNPKLWQSVSPLNYLDRINVPILLQHGTGDTTVPYSWSVELNDLLKNKNKNTKLISYPSDNHNLPLNWSRAISLDSQFYSSLLK